MKNQPFLIGITLYIIHLIFSNLNDIAAKYLICALPAIEIASFRFLFTVLTLLPIMVYSGAGAFKTKRIHVHILRGALLFAAMIMWIYSAGFTPLTNLTVMSFTIPIFVALLAGTILREKVGFKIWIAIFMALIGALIILQPFNYTFEMQNLILLVSAFMFAMLDVVNKYFVYKESILVMMFYSALVTTIASIYPVYLVWVTPTMTQLCIMALTGLTGNIMLYCLLRSFKLVAVSHLSPFRYLELVISAMMGFIIFSEDITFATVLGSVIIIPSTLIVSAAASKKVKE